MFSCTTIVVSLAQLHFTYFYPKIAKLACAALVRVLCLGKHEVLIMASRARASFPTTDVTEFASCVCNIIDGVMFRKAELVRRMAARL